MKKSDHRYKIATLFSGAGGLDSGFTKTGKFESQIANDILPAPAETYSKNHHTEIQSVDEFNETPKLPCYIVGDVSKVDFTPLKDIDCVIGGPPCQDFSQVRGSREEIGIHMTRGKLYSHFIRALTRAEPKIFVFENVPGLVSSNGGMAYKTITEDFENLNVRWSEIKNKIKKGPSSAKNYFLIFNDIVNSSDIGVPQKRKRLIIVGVRKDLIKPSDEGDLAKKSKEILKGEKSLLGKYPITAMEAFEGKTVPEISSKYSELMEEYRGIEKEVGTPEAFAWKSKVWDKLTFDAVEDYLTANAITPKDDGEVEVAFEDHKKVLKELGYYGKPLAGMKFEDESNEIPNEGSGVKSRMEHIPPNMNYLFVNGTEWKVKGTMSNIYRRSHPLKPGYTVMAYGGGGTWSYHYEKGRSMLTNRERARLQTFPDDYMFEGNRSQVRTQIGEAVPVRLGTKLAEITLTVLESIKSNYAV
ncbi:DNA cytosine methyltransferase [Nitrosopumilus sp.]|uniref:DNA cytosine methyltransferase n=1 Tax=Nitrosopumilus sp. TaxID=2024843 RepID=UPI0034A08E8E